MGNAFDGFIRRAGLRVIRPHDLRHTHATHLLAAGVNPRIVSERLGHASVAFTLDTYGHVMPGQQAAAAAAAGLVEGLDADRCDHSVTNEPSDDPDETGEEDERAGR